MYLECPVCGEEIEVINIVNNPGSFDEPPEFDYDFSEEHQCQVIWSAEQQNQFDIEVSEKYDSQDRDYEYDFYGEDYIKWE